ncbi:respiratory chain complex I subunit 1 family protein [Thiospirillum jenense]|uniref:NADH-quinone oxidoreductase subunit H n=1 Tax=Thiospirillum jenense TaxID=1653858 RepID=A0A839HFD6_9GAMM|nr:NADH-quinone oxidoreductase subunit H [Thiospirillum jenense]MBB1125122.1 NADH-quinone oxidoreductase subunit H [Thiospirillum jenense]
MTTLNWTFAIIQAMIYIVCAPLLVGWVRKLRAYLQNRRGAPLLQPYRDLRKWFIKETRVAHTASPIFTIAPVIVFMTTWLAASTIPLLTLNTPTTALADLIVLVGLLALGRFFLALAGMDIGTAFGGMGASREMLIAALAEPAMLIAVFTLAMSAHSTNLTQIIDYQLGSGFVLRPSYLFALSALGLVAMAEAGRIPVDNPTTHLELTMVHEAMLLEYSGRHLALMEWAAHIKLMLYGVLIANIFFPWGITTTLEQWSTLPIAILAVVLKLMLLALIMVIAETVLAKMRLFRVPGFLNLALLLALLGLLSHVMLEVGV